MKNLISIIFLFAALSLHAASPSFQQFNTNDFDVVTGTSVRVNTNRVVVQGGSHIDLNPLFSNPAYLEGRLFYDTNQNSLAYFLTDSNVTVNIGFEQLVRARNASGVDVTNGQAVYIQGVTGQIPKCWLAIATNESTSSVIGVATVDIPNNQTGYVCVNGLVNTVDTSSFNDGADLFLSASVLGGITTNEPVYPNYSVYIGECAYSHAINGKIFVSIHERWSRANGIHGTWPSASVSNLVVLSGQTNSGPLVVSNNIDAASMTMSGLTNDQVRIGTSAGQYATNAIHLNAVGYQAGRNSIGGQYANFFGYRAGLFATNAYNANYFGRSAGQNAVSANDANFFGYQAGSSAVNANNANFFGQSAGQNAAYASYANLFGYQAGYSATNAYYANFFGYQAGQNATNAHDSTFFGLSAGANASYAFNADFFGYQAGMNATNASYANFLGYKAGISATNATRSIFIGPYSGSDRADTLWIDSKAGSWGTYTPLIYGEFDNRLLQINGTLVGSNMVSVGYVSATNGFAIPVHPSAPSGVTNGLGWLWNSNGAVYLRTSTVGSTTEGTDTLLGTQ